MCLLQSKRRVVKAKVLVKSPDFDPDFQLAKNNLNWALGGLNK